MRAALLVLLWFAVSPVQAGELWNSLWHNADQRGERLLHEGNPGAAAQTYHDKRRKAYAELRAGDYQQAAGDFSTFDDSDGNYNRGNALAQAGQLQDALKAYDAALARDPDNRDARHNRDLVARALQQQAPQSDHDRNDSSKDGKGKSGQSGDTGNNNTQDGDQSGNRQGKQNANASGSQQADQGQSAQGKPGQEKSAQGGTGESQSAQDAGSGRDRQPPARQSLAGNAQQDKAQPGANTAQGAAAQTGPDSAAEAKRDADVALNPPTANNPGVQSNAPLSEQQLAQEQWLRRIPDDPGGLLRRKFMIEHMLRQQGGQP